MNFNQWYNWFKEAPIVFKWFLILVLLRPIIDNFYYLKEISILASPLYLVGVLTPIFILLSFISKNLHLSFRTGSDKRLGYWSILVLINSLIIVISSSFHIRSIEVFIKVTTPIFLYYYLRNFITNPKNLEGTLKTFYYSLLIPIFLLLYEKFIVPISPTISRGIIRIQGGYADPMNYAIYITLGFICASYFYIKYFRLKKNIGIKFISVTFLCFIGLISISHVSTVIVLSSLFLFLLVNKLKQQRVLSLIFLFSLLIATNLIFETQIYEQITPALEHEKRILEGDQPIEQALHGRISRWLVLMDDWGSFSVTSQAFGIVYDIKGLDSREWVLLGTHSDYLRILFLSGIIGLLFYLSFLYSIYKRSLIFNQHDKFLIQSALLVILGYSISTMPSIYPSLMYIILTIFAYASSNPSRHNNPLNGDLIQSSKTVIEHKLIKIEKI